MKLFTPNGTPRLLGILLKLFLSNRPRNTICTSWTGTPNRPSRKKKIRKVPSRERNDPCIGKRFFDKGDYEPGVKRKITDFNKGEFVVLCKQPGKNPVYHCERKTNIGGVDREIEEFDMQYVRKLVEKYEKE